MDITKFCNHTYLNWKNQKPVCVICSKEFEGDYNPHFKGTFPRKDYERSQQPEFVAQTVTLDSFDLATWVLE